VLLVPTGLIVTRIGDEVVVEREVTAVATPLVEVAPASQQQQGQQGEGQQSQGQQAKSSGQAGNSQSGQQTAADQSQSKSSDGQGQSKQQAAAGSSGGQEQDKGVLREATVVKPDIEADNGVIHAIAAVLVPQSELSKLESMPAQL
jgi:hypothetical protein